MPLNLTCGCGKKLKVRDELAGKKVKCPCGKILVVPVPVTDEPEEIVEAIEEDKAPGKPKPTAKQPTPAWASGKKKTPPAQVEDDADDEQEDEEAKPTPFWAFPGTMSTEVLALADDGVWFVSLKGDALKKTKKLLGQGDHPEEVMGKDATCVAWVSVVSIYCNKKLNGFTIHYTNGDDSVFKDLKPADKKTRDRILDEIAAYLKPEWRMTTTKLTAVTATLLPGGCITVDLILTGILAWVSTLVEDIEVHNRFGLKTTRGLGGVINMLGDLGPLWIGVIGLGIAILLTIWLLIRIINPPIEVTITRVPAEAIDAEECRGLPAAVQRERVYVCGLPARPQATQELAGSPPPAQAPASPAGLGWSAQTKMPCEGSNPSHGIVVDPSRYCFRIGVAGSGIGGTSSVAVIGGSSVPSIGSTGTPVVPVTPATPATLVKPCWQGRQVVVTGVGTTQQKVWYGQYATG